MSLGIAILGSGIFAREAHLPAIKACTRFSLKAVYSRSQKSAQALADIGDEGVIAYYDSPTTKGRHLNDLLARTDITAVVIALPITVQPSVIRNALEAGKHVLSEKPIAADPETALDLMAQRNNSKRGNIWAVAENFRFLNPITVGHRTLRDFGGDVTSFRVQLFTLIDEKDKFYQTSWRQKPEHQGGFLLDGGVHLVAGLRYLLEACDRHITHVASFTGLLQPRLAPLDTVHSLMRISNGRSGTFTMSYGTECKSCFEIEVITTSGSVLVTPTQLIITKKGLTGKMETSSLTFTFDGAVSQEIEAFAESIETKNVDPRMTPLQALADITILHALLISGEQNGSVREITII